MSINRSDKTACLTARLLALLATALITVPTSLSFAIPIATFWLATVANTLWLLSLITALTCSAVAWVIISIFADEYFHLRPIEVSGRFYERLGIRYFHHFVVGGDYFNYCARRYDPTYPSLKPSLLTEAESSLRFHERVHAVGLIFLLPPLICALRLGWYGFASTLTVWNILCNLYPIMLQRHLRGRIWRIRERRKGRVIDR
jgi:hypothetical protein